MSQSPPRDGNGSRPVAKSPRPTKVGTFGSAPRFGPNMDIDHTSHKRRSTPTPTPMPRETVSSLMLDAEALHHARKLTPSLTPPAEKEYVDRFLVLTGARPANSSGPIHFGQRSVNPEFSDNHGLSKGKTIGSEAQRLGEGTISPDSFPVTFVSVDRSRVTMNNRSLTTLSLAGMAPSKTIDATGRLPPSGEDSAAAFLERIHETRTVHQTEMPIRAGKERILSGFEEVVRLPSGKAAGNH